jgi:hypothetical protein
MKYKTTFTIRPSKGKYLLPLDVAGKIADGEECCVITDKGERLCAFHQGSEFTRVALHARILNVTEATPIPAEDQWPKGCDWSTDDWEDRGIYPPKPVQPAVLIVTLPDGREIEVEAPFTDETPEGDFPQEHYQWQIETFRMFTRFAYQVDHSAVRWAWQEKQ